MCQKALVNGRRIPNAVCVEGFYLTKPKQLKFTRQGEARLGLAWHNPKKSKTTKNMNMTNLKQRQWQTMNWHGLRETRTPCDWLMHPDAIGHMWILFQVIYSLYLCIGPWWSGVFVWQPWPYFNKKTHSFLFWASPRISPLTLLSIVRRWCFVGHVSCRNKSHCDHIFHLPLSWA